MNTTPSYRGYQASMIFDADDKIIVGRVLGIDDIITFHGDSVEDFEANFHAVISDYIAACAQLESASKSPPAAN